MRELRLKFALILIASVIAVVLMATVLTAWLVNGNEPRRFAGPLARNMAMAIDLVSPSTEARLKPHTEIVDTLPDGIDRPDLAQEIAHGLAFERRKNPVVVRETGDDDYVAATELPDGRWLLFPIPKPPPVPPQMWLSLGSWVGLMVIGIVAVALVLANRVTQPFRLIERAIASVGPDGILPRTPEVGSGEARRMARALNQLSDRVKAGMDSRMRLVAAAGHDLRTPMTRMRLRAEFLPDSDRAGWLDDIAELEAIADSAIHLVKEEGAGEDQGPVALDALVRETASQLAATDLPVSIDQLDPVIVTAGPLALRRALRNLFTNAATHGGGGHVSLSIVNQRARLVIEDTGPGIPEELIPRVFEPFFRADPARGQPIKGAGLGLAIAREIIERFGGAIEISNRPEGGLRQVVTMPVVPAAA